MKKGLVVITGASSGFGLETAKLFEKAGYPMLLLARNIELIEALGFEDTLVRSVDVTDAKAFKSAIDEAVAIYGSVDLLVNSAGVMQLGNIESQNKSEWDTMINVNLKGVLNGIQAVLNPMIEKESGTIINISSIAGFKTFTNHAVYSATKYGVHALSETLREEVAMHNVRMLVVSPGAAETNLLSHTTSQDIKDDYMEWKETMGGKAMDPVHVANAIFMMYSLPQEVSVREIVIAKTKQDN